MEEYPDNLKAVNDARLDQFIESKHVNLKEAQEVKNDFDYYKSPLHVKNKHKALIIRKKTMDNDFLLDRSFDERLERVIDHDIIEELKKDLEIACDKVSPLIYLNTDQREKLLKCVYFVRYIDKCVLYSFGEKDDLNCYILMEGEMQIFNKKNLLIDVLADINFFGYQGPIFKKRTHSVVIEQDSIVAYIPRNDFLNLICPFSKFSKFISRNILNKDKMFNKLDDFKNYVLHSLDSGKLDNETLLGLYLKINSCLHISAKSSEIDYNAWSYALNRLPSNIFTTFTYILINKIPTIFSTQEAIALELIPRVSTELRNRDVFKYMEGKSLVIVREMETDVLDFVSNLCIHMIESKKLRHMLNSPLIIAALYENRNLPFKDLIKIIDHLIPSKLDVNRMEKVFDKDIAQKMLNVILHYEDYSISVMKGIVNDRDPVENFIQNLWINSKELLGIKTSVDNVDELIVDIMQGSKRTLVNCISPHIYINKDRIISWAEKEISEGRLKLKTTAYRNLKYNQEDNNDLLWCYSYYYYETFPDENKAKKKMEEEHGIRYITKTFSTGVAVILINPNKFDINNMDQSIGFKKPISKNHLIIHIGYTFGAQSKEIIKPILLLFGSKAKSLNIMGKAGGLIGKRKDILISNKIFYDKTNDVTNVDIGNLDIQILDQMINNKTTDKTQIHIGPMLTVSGTILQNELLLLYYQLVMGCIGLEMEGYFYAKEIESAVKHMILQNKFYTRCFYYTSDLPLDPTQNLASEGEMVNWEEGVQTMNAIQRFILKKVLLKEEKEE